MGLRTFFQDFYKKADIVLLLLCIATSIYGLFLIYTATRWMDTNTFVQKQGLATAIGVVLYVVLSVIDFKNILEKCWKYLLIFNVVFLLLLLTSLGTSNDSGNRNWLSIPGFPLDIQPNEIVKASFILLTAYFLSRIQEQDRSISEFPSIFKIAGHSLLTIGLVAVICGDWGMCVIYACIVLMMLWVAGLKLRWFVLGFSAFFLGIYTLWVYILPYSSYWTDYRVMRFRIVLDKTLDPLNVGWQQTRSMLALGSGKLFGQGYMQGIQTQSASSSSLPARHTDFIFSACGEELGFVGCVLLLILLISIVLRCIWIAQRVDSYFSAYVAMGMVAMLSAQIFFNVGMCLYILPTMGLTLPFVSYGGSSVITFYASMGIVSSLRSRNLPSWIRDRAQL